MNGSDPKDVEQDRDLLFLELLSYHGPLTATELIRFGLEAGVDPDVTQRWLISAGERGLIQRSLTGRADDPWRLS
jgi:hypothetical protein